jgi:hypothetical protein
MPWRRPSSRCYSEARRRSRSSRFRKSTIAKGEIQLQYRGAQHDGVQRGTPGPNLPDDEEAPLRQSREFEIQMSITSHWPVAITHGFDKPDGDSLNLTALEAETQVELITLEGNGLGFAIQGGFEKAVGRAAKNEPGDVHFGPIVELAKDKLLLTLNPLFFKERGPYADQQGLGFGYGWQAKYQWKEKLALAFESFGEVQDLADAGPLSEQLHSIGPAVYYTIGEADEEKGEGRELTVSLGAQFGQTPQTSDAALKVFIGYEFF